LSTLPGKYLSAQTGNRFGDYAHGRRVFADNNNELVPKFSFLYHVFFDINTDTQYNNNLKTKTLGLMVKSMDLPKFTMQTKDLHAYNQHVVVQTGIKYDAINMQFHDDSADLVREFWYNYMTYYYGDADNDINSLHTFQDNRYTQRTSQQFGYRNRANTRFLNSVKLYSMSKGHYSEYTLVNPTIDSWQHGSHQAGQNEFIGHAMRIKYETVLYAHGEIARNSNPPGFAQEHYDNTPKGLGPNVTPSYRGLDAAPGYIVDKNTGLPRPSQSNTLLGRLGNFALNTAIGAAQNKLARTNLGNGFVGVIGRNAANAAFSGVASAVTNKSNQFFPSLGKVFTPSGSSSANVTGKGIADNRG